MLAEETARLLPKRRVLEFYVNYAQFAPNVYGMCAASWYFYGHSSRALTVKESAALVGLLPSPLHVHRAPGGGMAFDDTDQDGRITRAGAGFISAENVWRALDRAPKWMEQVGGFDATRAVGVDGLAADQPRRRGLLADAGRGGGADRPGGRGG